MWWCSIHCLSLSGVLCAVTEQGALISSVRATSQWILNGFRGRVLNQLLRVWRSSAKGVRRIMNHLDLSAPNSMMQLAWQDILEYDRAPETCEAGAQMAAKVPRGPKGHRRLLIRRLARRVADAILDRRCWRRRHRPHRPPLPPGGRGGLERRHLGPVVISLVGAVWAMTACSGRRVHSMARPTGRSRARSGSWGSGGAAGPCGRGRRPLSQLAAIQQGLRGLAVRLYTDHWWSSPARCHGNYTAPAEGWMTASANRIDVY